MPLLDTDLHIDAALSNVSVMYKNPAFVADQLSPRVPVKKRSDKIKEYDKTLFKLINTMRRDKAKSHGISWAFADDITYLCEKYALHDLVSQDDRDNADQPIRPNVDTTEIITMLLNLDREIRIKDLFITTTNYTSTHVKTLTGTQRWDEYGAADSEPFLNIRDAKSRIFDSCRVQPNVIMIPYKVALVLAEHPNLKEIIKYTHSDLLTAGGLPPAIKGLRVIEAGAGYDSAQEGQTASLTDVWSDYIWIGYVKPRLGIKDITFSVSPSWKGRIARKWHDNAYNADVIEIEEQGIDEKIIAKDCGYLIVDVLT